jgi:hypothetical protein
MNIYEFADKLTGRQMGFEISRAEELQAKELGFVVIFGASDDLAEIRGAIDDEVGCFDGGMILLDKNGLFEDCDCECKHSEAAKEKTKSVEAVWDDGTGLSWSYKTDIPHATFEIVEDGEPYCRGIVFDIRELAE